MVENTTIAKDSSVGQFIMKRRKQDGAMLLLLPSTVKDGQEYLLGRANTKEDNKLISREQCSITKNEGEFFLKDLGARNGTYLDGFRITPNQSVPLKTGQTITLGGNKFVFGGIQEKK